MLLCIAKEAYVALIIFNGYVAARKGSGHVRLEVYLKQTVTNAQKYLLICFIVCLQHFLMQIF